MAFVNEYIPAADLGKHDLRRVCEAHNLVQQGCMCSRDWTIDRVRDIFLIQVWLDQDSEASGWAFCWKGRWMFFEEDGSGGGGPKADGTCWFGYRIKGFSVPPDINHERDTIVRDLTQAFADYCGGGVFSPYAHGAATIEFI